MGYNPEKRKGWAPTPRGTSAVTSLRSDGVVIDPRMRGTESLWGECSEVSGEGEECSIGDACMRSGNDIGRTGGGRKRVNTEQ